MQTSLLARVKHSKNTDAHSCCVHGRTDILIWYIFVYIQDWVEEDLWAAREAVLERRAAGIKAAASGGGGARESDYAGGVRFDTRVQERIFQESLP